MSAFYAGLDVSDMTVALCVIDDKGALIHEESVATNPTAIVRALKPYRKTLAAIGQESGAKAPWIHKELVKRKYPVLCLDARITSASLGAQRNKTDKNDARSIANVIRTGWFTQAHVKGDEALRTRLMLTHRRILKRSAIKLEMSLRISLKTFGATVTKKAGELTVHWSTRSALPSLEKLSQTMLRARAALLKEVKALDQQLIKLAKGDPVCRRLMTIPGVGPVTAVTYRAAIDDPTRFKSSRNVAAHFGLTPRRYQSGQMDISGRISRMGDESVRSALYEAAFVLLVLSKSKCSLRVWGLRQRARKGVRHAAVAVARKMAVIMHRMWITGRDFDSSPAVV